MIVLKVCQGE